MPNRSSRGKHPRPIDRTSELCPGSSQPIPSESVNMNGQTAVIHTAICPDCAQRVDVWLSGPVGQPTAKWILVIRHSPEPISAVRPMTATKALDLSIPGSVEVQRNGLSSTKEFSPATLRPTETGPSSRIVFEIAESLCFNYEAGCAEVFAASGAERRDIITWNSRGVQSRPLAGRRAPSPRTPLPHLPRFAMDRDFQGPTLDKEAVKFD